MQEIIQGNHLLEAWFHILRKQQVCAYSTEWNLIYWYAATHSVGCE